jgi:hypothetical protein
VQACLDAEEGGSWPADQFCQKAVTSSSLYVAGAILVSFGTLLAVVYAVLGWKDAVAAASSPQTQTSQNESNNSTVKEGEQSTPTPVTSAAPTTLQILTPCVLNIATLFALLAAICIVAAQAVGISAYVTDQHPTASESPDGFQNRWVIGRPALVFSSVAWLSAVLGVWVAGTGGGVYGR